MFDRIREIIADQTGQNADDITMETNVKTELEADSLDIFQIINDIEDEFDVKIENLEAIQTVGDVVKIVEENKN